MPPLVAFRLSTYLSLGVACACLGYSEFFLLPEAGLFAALVIVALIVIYRLEDRVTLLSIPDANKLGGGIFLLCLLWATYRVLREVRLKEFQTLGIQYLMVALFGPILMTLIPAKLLRCDKHVVDYWYFQAIGLAAVVLAGAMASDAISIALISLYAVSAVWSLALFLPARTTGLVPANSNGLDDDSPPPAPSTAQSIELGGRHPGRVLCRAIMWTGLSALAAIPVYLLTPRSTFGRLEFSNPRIEVGYASDQMIDLNRAGNLESNPEIAFEVDAFEGDGSPKLDLSLSQRWRGTVLVDYHSGSWRKARTPMPLIRNIARQAGKWQAPTLGPKTCSLTFTVQTKVGALVLADPVNWIPNEPAPVATLDGTIPRPWQANADGTFSPTSIPIFNGPTVRYVQYSHALPDPDLGPAIVLAESLDFEDLNKHRQLVLNPVARVKEYADDLLARLIRDGTLPPGVRPIGAVDRTRVSADSGLPPEYHEAVARAFCTHLVSSANLEYSTKLRRENKSIDPIEEFLFQSRVGHCERFASALVLLLRSQGIPAVLVLGFKGCEHAGNGHYIVRQENAHAWVEALISRPTGPDNPRVLDRNGNPQREWHWLSLDPQPTTDAREKVEQSGSWWQRVIAALDLYLLDYSPEQRNRALLAMRDLFLEPTLYVVLASVTVLYMIVTRLRRRSRKSPEPDVHESWLWYRRLLDALNPHGYSTQVGQTPAEFAATVRESLASRPGSVPFADVPIEWTNAYYQSRFGDRPISDSEKMMLETRLDKLREALNTKSKASQP